MGRIQRDQTDRTTAERVLRAAEQQHGRRKRADKIADEDERPVDSSARVVTLPLAQAMTIRLLPVNSSAPADDDQDQTKRKDKAGQETNDTVGKAAGQRAAPSAEAKATLPALTVVAKIAPNEMNAPPSTLQDQQLSADRSSRA